VSTLAAVFFGELLMRLGTKGFQRFLQANEFEVAYTGAEANSAVSLANYGLDAFVVSAVPQTDIGQACINYIRRFGVNTDHIKRCGKRLGTFYLETGASQRPSRVISICEQGLVPFFRHGTRTGQKHAGRRRRSVSYRQGTRSYGQL